MSVILTIAAFLGLMFILLFIIALFLLGYPLLTEPLVSANTSSTVTLSNYPGWVPSVNAIPWIVWILLLILIGFAFFIVIKRKSATGP